MSWLKPILIFCFLIILVLAGIKLVHIRKQQIISVQAAQEPAMAVQTAQVSTGTLEHTQTYRGVLRPEHSINLTPRIQGQIMQMYADAGDRVKNGQLLVQIDDREIKENIQALVAEKKRIEEQIWILEKTHSRQKNLAPGAISQDDLDRTLSNLNQAKSSREKIINEIGQANTRLSYTRLKANMDGRIQKRFQEPGDMAQPGQPIMSLEDVSAGYNIHIRIPPTVQSDVHLGQDILLTRKGQKLNTVISRIHPATTQGSPLIEVEAFVQDPPFGLASGSSLESELMVSRTKGLLVPTRSVLGQENGDIVFRVDADHRIQAHQVQILAQDAEKAVVQGHELQSGQQVVVGPMSQLMRLSSGMKVKSEQMMDKSKQSPIDFQRRKNAN
jgi:RND family efflux transporter MFP subunit